VLPAHGREVHIDALLIFPHQLFESNAALARNKTVYLVEDALYFRHYSFHKQKLLLHRASMRAHAAYLEPAAARVVYVDSADAPSMQAVIALIARDADTIHYIDPVDDWLQRRLERAAAGRCKLARYGTEMFLNDLDALRKHIDKRAPSMAAFYTAERKRRHILVSQGRPDGGKWSLDAENRQRLPKNIMLPAVPNGANNKFVREARDYVETQFGRNPGALLGVAYPVTYADARQWLQQFLEQRLRQFGAYEDAISTTERVLFHSVLTPMLNTGLLTPGEVIDSTLAYARQHEIPLNSLEGFVRQIIGWREYIRGNYEFHGRAQRTRNFWGHDRPLPRSFWTASTGIAPVDAVIGRILQSGYAHHIERLMVLANFMLLCEFSPDDVYRWFMEMFIDAYDWVMVPNVYGMGLHADGGQMMTKPYISGSAYLLRMSDFKRGPWCAVWDGLFWRFIARHRDFFSANPRLNVMVRNLERMGDARLQQHVTNAETWLANLN
jgi:deoxyribodipyrimidine photolyase-related protein